MPVTYVITEEAVKKAVEQFGLRAMTRGDLAAVIVRNKNINQYSSQVLVTAARGQRFVRRVMGWT